MEDSQENLQNYSYSQSEEKNYSLFYEDIEQKEKSSNKLDNSRNSLSLRNSIHPEICIIPEKYSNVHFLCKNCLSIPTIEFINVLNVIYTCGCYKNYQINIIQFFDETLLTIDEKDEEKNKILLDAFYCRNHKKQNFFYYCKKCHISVCRQCLRKEKEHKDHYFFIFHQLKNEANKKIEFIKENFCLSSFPFDRESSSFLDDNLQKVKEYYEKFINVLINDYNNHICYSHFIIISNLFQVLENSNKKKETNIYKEKEIIISNFDNLKKIVYDNPSLSLITTIKLTDSNISNISQICEANLINLQILNLRRNFISDIELLLSAKFKNILALDFSLNKLGDENIEKISHLKFKNLGYLNLLGNDFLDYKLFDLCSNKIFKNLKILYAGSNKFNNYGINDNIIFDLSELEEIGLSNGVFNDETIHLINRFDFKNLRKLFLHSNNLSSLSFVDDLNLPNIEEIWVNNNSIDEYYPLCKYKTLKFINIRRNCIKNIDNLILFIKEFKKLEKIDIRFNELDYNDNKNENIILKVKERGVDIDYI